MSEINLLHRFYNPFLVCCQLFKGKTLMRALFNLALKKHKVSGQVLDLGSKSRSASYYEFLNFNGEVNITFTDLKATPGLVQLDVEKPFNLDSESFDVVLAFHLFEHVYEYRRAPGEVMRVLKPGGKVFVSVPFMHEYHADHDDFVRLTDSGLRRVWESVGLKCVHMEAIGEGILTAAFTKLTMQIIPRRFSPFFTMLAYLLFTIFDRLVSIRPKIDGRTVPQRFALEYLAIFEKPL